MEVSTELSDKILQYKNEYDHHREIMFDLIGIPKYILSDIENKEIEYKHTQFLIKYNLL